MKGRSINLYLCLLYVIVIIDIFDAAEIGATQSILLNKDAKIRNLKQRFLDLPSTKTTFLRGTKPVPSNGNDEVFKALLDKLIRSQTSTSKNEPENVKTTIPKQKAPEINVPKRKFHKGKVPKPTVSIKKVPKRKFQNVFSEELFESESEETLSYEENINEKFENIKNVSFSPESANFGFPKSQQIRHSNTPRPESANFVLPKSQIRLYSSTTSRPADIGPLAMVARNNTSDIVTPSLSVIKDQFKPEEHHDINSLLNLHVENPNNLQSLENFLISELLKSPLSNNSLYGRSSIRPSTDYTPPFTNSKNILHKKNSLVLNENQKHSRISPYIPHYYQLNKLGIDLNNDNNEKQTSDLINKLKVQAMFPPSHHAIPQPSFNLLDSEITLQPFQFNKTVVDEKKVTSNVTRDTTRLGTDFVGSLNDLFQGITDAISDILDAIQTAITDEPLLAPLFILCLLSLFFFPKKFGGKHGGYHRRNWRPYYRTFNNYELGFDYELSGFGMEQLMSFQNHIRNFLNWLEKFDNSQQIT